MAKDPKFLIVKHDLYTSNTEDPNMILFDVEGNLLLRNSEIFLNKFEGSVEILRFPEYFQLLSAEKFQWTIYITTERIICYRALDHIKNLFELMDHVDINGDLYVVDPAGSISSDEMFKLVEKKNRNIKEFSMAFQVAFSRLSSISINKVETRGDKATPGAIEIWYKDSDTASDSQITLYPSDLHTDNPYQLGIQIQKSSLEEKLRCTEKKHEIDKNWNLGDYNTWKSTLTRLIQKPDMLAQGSGDLNSDSWDPIIFQAHPIQWLSDVFNTTLKPGDKTHSSIN